MNAGNEKIAKKTKRLPKSVYYRRRIIALLLLVLMIIGLVLGIRYVISISTALMESAKAPKIKKNTAVVATEPGNCNLKDLDLIITKLKSNSVPVGEQIPITVELRNKKPDKACYVEATQKLIGVAITTGDTPVWDSSACTKEEKKVPLLLGKQMNYATEIVWDAKVYSECNPTQIAKPGTYLITATVNGKKTESVVSLVITPPSSAVADKEN